jgi:hypothetical protein
MVTRLDKRTLSVLAVLAGGPCAAQPFDIQQNLVAPHEACIRRSAAAQMRMTTDRDLAVENAFLACATEEGRIRTYFILRGVSPEKVEAVILQRKMILKQTLTR